MRYRYTESQVISTVSNLNQRRLEMFIKEEHVAPVLTEKGRSYSKPDLARLELLCDLLDDFECNADTAAIIISLVDQLHGVRGEMRRLLTTVEAEPTEVRNRILAGILSTD